MKVTPVSVYVVAVQAAGLPPVMETLNVPSPVGPQLEAVTFTVMPDPAGVGTSALAIVAPGAPSQAIIVPACIEETCDLKLATVAFVLALLKLTSTTDAKIPMIAITIKSSISVNPFLFFSLYFSASVLYFLK